MSTDSLRVSAIVPASPERIYDAWLDATLHSKMTGSPATVEPVLFGRFTAWDGYIDGVNLELDRARRIVQTWRTTDFPATCPDSRLEVRLEEVDGGARITFLHTDVPGGQGPQYEKGWNDFYLVPMTKYFATARPEKAKAEASTGANKAGKKPAKKVAKKATKKPAKKAAKKATRKPAKKVAKKATKKLAKKVAKKGTKAAKSRRR